MCLKKSRLACACMINTPMYHLFLLVGFDFSSSSLGVGVLLLLYSHDLEADEESISGGSSIPGSTMVDETGSPFSCSDSALESDSDSGLK